MAAAQAVMLACGWSNPRLAPVVARALEGAAREHSSGVEEWAKTMRSNWAAYVRDGPLLRWTVSPRKWVADGHWMNFELWPYDAQRLEQAKRRF